MFVDYSDKYEEASKTLKESCKSNAEFNEVVKQFEGRQICADQSISQHLFEITQKIPCHKQIMEKYVECLPKDSDECRDSKEALDEIAKCEESVKERMGQNERFKKLLEIQKMFVGDNGDSLISPHRKLLLEGELTSHPPKKESCSFRFFLFSDFLLYAYPTNPQKTLYQVVRRVPLDGMWVTDWENSTVQFGMKINSKFQSFRLGASTIEEKEKWKEALKSAVSAHEKRVKRKPLYKSKTVDKKESLQNFHEHYPAAWIPDYSVKACNTCKARFHLVRRRHHCRSCGDIICGQCSLYSSADEYGHTEEKQPRICKSCYADTYNKISGHLYVQQCEWKKQFFEITESTLHVFEKDEDGSPCNNITLADCVLTYPFPDKVNGDELQWSITQPGDQHEPIVFKADSVKTAKKWIEVLKKNNISLN